MSCKNCISPQSCVNYDESTCKECVKFDGYAKNVGVPKEADYACFKCKSEQACVVAAMMRDKKSEVKQNYKTEEIENEQNDRTV